MKFANAVVHEALESHIDLAAYACKGDIVMVNGRKGTVTEWAGNSVKDNGFVRMILVKFVDHEKGMPHDMFHLTPYGKWFANSDTFPRNTKQSHDGKFSCHISHIKRGLLPVQIVIVRKHKNPYRGQ